MIRQPIVSILGHVDHGKTLLLDRIRGSALAEREAGRITQHIGATETPLKAIYKLCSELIRKKFKIPGLLFIDTPGHHAFTTLRARGGVLADVAVLVVDVTDGLMPQSYESLRILRRHNTPFVVAANKIDLVEGYKANKAAFIDSYKKQTPHGKEQLDKRLYRLIEQLYDQGFTAQRYDKIKDFTKNVGIIPTSAKTGEGIADLLMVLTGLAQKFLTQRLRAEKGAGKGVVLEIKEVHGLGLTLDAIVYNGVVKRGDALLIGGKKPIETKVKGLFKPEPLAELREAGKRFRAVNEVRAASGVKISAKGVEEVIAGSPLRVVDDDKAKIIRELRKESKISVSTQDDGVVIKADTIGALEALAHELKERKVPIKKAEIGNVSKRDLVEASTTTEPLRRAILGFNVELLEPGETAVPILRSNVIYELIDLYEEWCEKRAKELEELRRAEIVYPGKVKILEGCVFRISKPAIVGVRVLGGRIHKGQSLMRADGRVIGSIKSIRSADKSYTEISAGKEVAIAMQEPTVGRQIEENQILYVDIPAGDAKKLRELKLTQEDKEVFEELIAIKRKEDRFWGM